MSVKTLTFASIFVLLLAIAFVFVFSAFAGADEEIEWSQVPPKVQKTIIEYMQDGEIEKIEKEIKKKKVLVSIYAAKVKKPDGKKIQIKVDENGVLIELDDD